MIDSCERTAIETTILSYAVQTARNPQNQLSTWRQYTIKHHRRTTIKEAHMHFCSAYSRSIVKREKREVHSINRRESRPLTHRRHSKRRWLLPRSNALSRNRCAANYMYISSRDSMHAPTHAFEYSGRVVRSFCRQNVLGWWKIVCYVKSLWRCWWV